MKAEARRWDTENNAIAHTAPWDCFADGMAHAAALIEAWAEQNRPTDPWLSEAIADGDWLKESE